MQIDGTGNRIAAMCYGPGTVYVLIGRNKIVSGGCAQAVKRIKEVSCPLNARRFQLHNPCARDRPAATPPNVKSRCATLSRVVLNARPTASGRRLF